MTLLERFLIGIGLWFGGLNFSVLFLGRTKSLTEANLIAVLLFSLVLVAPAALKWLSDLKKSWPKKFKANLVISLLLFVIFLHVVLQLIGALAPEIKFDALWYHLTEAKTYLQEGQIRTFYPPAQLSQSSVTPRLQDLLYVFTLAFWPTEQLAKLLNFVFGALSLLGVYAVGRRFGNSLVGLLAALIFASFPIFGWLAQTAYIDLSVAFYFSLAALVFFAGVPASTLTSFALLGLFLSTKIWALIILPVVFGYQLYQTRSFDRAIAPLAGALLIASPWFFEALITTGNPVFPIFSLNQPELLGGYASAPEWLIRGWPTQFWPNFKRFFIHDFALLALVPGLLVGGLIRIKLRSILGLIVVSAATYFLFSFISNPDPRFLLPFLVVAVVLLSKLWFEQGILLKIVAAVAMIAIIFANFLPLYFRTAKTFPVVFAKQSRQDYLEAELGKNVHSFIDVDNQVANQLKPGDRLVTLVHNMFYIEFPHRDGFDLKIELAETGSPQELLTKLKNLGFSHILVKTREYKLKDLFALGNFSQLSQDEYEQIVPIVWSSKETNTALYKIP